MPLLSSFQSAMDLGPSPSESRTEIDSRALSLEREGALDHFITRDGVTFAGTHLIIDLWGAQGIDDLERTEAALCEAVEVAGATLLHIHLHHFTPNGGISGVAVLAESHISIHTWPERGYAALDVFMCGDAEPARAIPVLEAAFRPTRTEVSEHRRGSIAPPRAVTEEPAAPD